MQLLPAKENRECLPCAAVKPLAEVRQRHLPSTATAIFAAQLGADSFSGLVKRRIL